MTTAAKKPSGGDKSEQGAFDFWDGELAPEGHHPLTSPLPNSVWEKFNKHRELLGKPNTFLSDHLKEAEERGNANPVGDSEPYQGEEKESPRQTRLRLWRRKRGSLQTTAAEHPGSFEAPHADKMSESQLKQHLIQHHGWGAANAENAVKGGFNGALSMHHMEHNDGSELFHHHSQGDSGEHPHHSGMNEEQVKQHLIHQHGIPENSGSLQTGLKDMQETHGLDHQADDEDYHQLNHTHTPASNAPSTKEIAKPKGAPAIATHLTDHHGLQDWEVDLLDDGDEGLKSAHSHEHSSTSSKPDHTHPEHDPLQGHSDEATPATPVSGLHPSGTGMKGKEFVQHLKDHHGLSNSDIVDLKDQGKHPDASPMQAVHDWHEHVHTHGDPGHAHQSANDGPEQLKHPDKYSVSSLHGHLLEDHGINPDHMENAINGTFEATNASHVVHMLHNKAHAEGQNNFAHTHENWSGGPEVHKGHQDVAKPFWGSPPSTAQKSLAHLTASKKDGGHGMDPAEVASKSGALPWDDDKKSQAAYENLHGNIHMHGGADLGHQHVPTTQPNVLSPEKIKKEKLKKHLKDYHGVDYSGNPENHHSELHDPEAFAYQGHPNHEHPSWDKHGPVTQELPSSNSLPSNKNPGPDDFVSGKPFSPGHHEHPANMSANDLANHIAMKHSGWQVGKNGADTTAPSSGDFSSSFFDHLLDAHTKSKEQLLQEHALHHASGETDGHTHESVGMTSPLEDQNAHYGSEPEIQTDTHPAVQNDHEALAHIIKHHPNVTDEDYGDWAKSHPYGKPSMVSYHKALHTPGSKTAMGNTLPKVLDGHDHAEPSGVPTTIAVGHHLVHEHGMSQEDVAGMTPAEFKAHHEQLHLKASELDVGHGHDYPGGPQRDPRVMLPNTHHEAMRDDSKDVSTQEWYHGTGTEYDGPPKNATELKNDHDFWGNFGGGDWNNHIGTHWTSLHQMAKNFNSGSSRVIHAKLHMGNPIKYNSLNHMTHDAYERLHASGHMQDDGEFLGNHSDDIGGTGSGCCSERLLEYAKGHHRDDGKFGLEAFRDSLRASGHDGIHVRNQADTPRGHWNAIPLSADQIEITHGGCREYHNDARDNDVDEFESNRGKLTHGWEHPKRYKEDQYTGSLGHLPSDDEVSAAHGAKGAAPTSNKTAIGRGDSDKYITGSLDDLDHDNDTSHWCSHCDEHGDHESDDCQHSKWCSVCEESGDHEAGDSNSPHSYCDHCEEYADHSSDDCEENPENWKKESYCPHCDQVHKENLHSETCHNCGENLPDWGKLQTFGKPVKPHEYQEDGETDTAFGHASEAKLQGFNSSSELASHLYHHHKSDVGGKAFDDNGSWDEESLKHHHQWLHQNPDEAKSQGFQVDHEHKNLYGQFKKKMTPEETHAHLMLSHVGPGGGIGSLGMKDVTSMTPEQAVTAHKKTHDADDAVQWGEKDSDGDLIHKVTHTHNLEGDQGSFDEEHYPKGDHLLVHIQDKKFHMAGLPPHVTDVFEKHPKVAEALHQQLHQNFGPSAEPGVGKYHVHTPEMNEDLENNVAIKKHLVDDHGVDKNHYQVKSGKSTEDLMELHHQEHTSQFPTFQKPDHTHMGGTAHKIPSKHTADTMKKKSEPEPEAPVDLASHKLEWPDEKTADKPKIKLHSPIQNKYAPGSVMHHIQSEHSGTPLDDLAGDVLDTAADHGTNAGKTNSHYLEMAKAHKAYHQEHGHPGHAHFDDEPHPKEASRKTLFDLFEEVTL